MARLKRILALCVIATLSAFSYCYDLMIICPDDFVEALAPLIPHKAKVGFSAQIVTLSQITRDYPRMADGSIIRDAPERVKYAIYDHYVNHGVQYVMLVGDGNVFPIRYTRGYLDDYTPNNTYPTAEMIWEPSDLYYADVVDSRGNWESWNLDSPTNELYGEIYRDGVNYDEIDYHPDVMLARIPASSVEEVENYVTKIIRYEYLTSGEAWFDNMIFSARELGGWDPIGNFETIISEMNLKGFSPVRLYHDEFYNLVATPTATPTPTPYPPYPAKTADPVPVNFNFYLNAGAGFLFHSGHGNPTAWTGGCYADTNMSGLTNWNRLPVIFAVSCETARYCPYIPYDDYWKKSGGKQTKVARYSIGSWICPEPSPFQRDTYNRRCMAEAWLVERLDGAIGYFGCVNTGERQSLYLGRKFFTAYTPGCAMGEMWRSALEDYYAHYRLSRYDRDFEGNNGDTWIFHHPSRFHLFGDPSLKVGGASSLPADNTPPVTTHNVTRQWYKDRFTLELAATDAGSGVRHTGFRIGASPVWSNYRSREFTATPDTAITFTVYYQAEDFLRNQETLKSVSFGIDNKLPSTPSMSLSGDSPTMDIADFGGPVTVNLNCSDSDSGMQYITYVLYEWNYRYEEYSVARRDYMTPPYPWTFSINRPGKYRLVAWGVDNVGNEGYSAAQDFVAIWVNEPDIFRDMAHIMRGPFMITLPPKLELPFDPEEVRFDIRRIGGDWISLGTDNNPQDGWSYNWNTQQYPDGLYHLRAIAFDLKPEGAPEKQPQKEIPMGSVATLNRETDSWAFTLDENPRIADRGEQVEHIIKFSHKDDKPLNNLDIFFDLGANNQYNAEKVEILDGGKLDENGIIHWEKEALDADSVWSVRFRAGCADGTPSGYKVTSYAYLRCDEIPLLTSDDPETKEIGDPTFFTIEAKGGKIFGKVLDAYLRQSLEGTTVTLQGVGFRIADENGCFEFKNLTAGEYEISASNPPEFGEKKIKAPVDGDSVSIDLFLPRNDLIPPIVTLDEPFSDYVAGDDSDLNGSAEDNPLGSGVAEVAVALRRLSDGKYWNGDIWETSQIWFIAMGTESWNASLNLKYDSQETYALLLRGKDNMNNVRIEETQSSPPTPKALGVQKTGSKGGAVTLSFSWDPVPGCDYLLEVTSRPSGGYAYIYEYLMDSQYEITTFFNPGVYYWRAYARNGNNYSSASETQALLIPGSGEESGVVIY